MTPSKTAADWVAKLAANEELSIVRGLGSLAFVRAQGRTLEERSQEKVLDLLWAIRGDVDSILSREAFDQRHHAWIERVVEVLRTNRQAQLAYGHLGGHPNPTINRHRKSRH